MAEVEGEPRFLRVSKIGDSIGVILPEEWLARLDWKEGDKLHVVEGAGRVLTLAPYDLTHAKAMDISRRSFREFADAYKELGK